MAGASEGAAQRRGVYVIAVLAIATLLEFVVALAIDNTPLLILGLSIFAVAKAAVIIDEFMHARRLAPSYAAAERAEAEEASA
jgi:hypothetical protein